VRPNVIDDVIAGARFLHPVACGAQVCTHDGSLLGVVFHEQNSQVGWRRGRVDSPVRRVSQIVRKRLAHSLREVASEGGFERAVAAQKRLEVRGGVLKLLNPMVPARPTTR
jgi:hypothetical protein